MLYGFNKKDAKRIGTAVKNFEQRAIFRRLEIRKPALEQPVSDWFLALITNIGPEGEPDYEDDRYYFKAAKLTNSDNDPTAPLVIEEITDAQDPDYIYDSCVNLAEQITRGHVVPCNTPVLMYATISDQSINIKRFWFTA